jgi:hypothetical protein
MEANADEAGPERAAERAPGETHAPEEGSLMATERFWRAFGHYDHGRCWFAETEEEEAGSAAMEWDIRGPARFAAERDRALRTGGSRLAAKVPLPFGEVGVCGRAGYALRLLASLYALAEQVEAEARNRGWELTVGVLAYREPEGVADEDETDAPEDDLVTDLDPEDLAHCETIVLWVEMEIPAAVEAAWRLGDSFGRWIAGAATWLERLDSGDREALRSVPRLRSEGS